jgi:hypothetical protein
MKIHNNNNTKNIGFDLLLSTPDFVHNDFN